MNASHWKIILASSGATLAVAVLLFKLFHVSLLASMGMATVSAQTLHSLKASKHIIERMKQRNLSQKKLAHKRFVKRTGKKLITSSAAALTFGTVAVAAATVGLEAEDYCSYLSDLEDERAILESRPASFDHDVCIETATSDLDALVAELTEVGFDAMSDVF